MKFGFGSNLAKRAPADVLMVPLFEGERTCPIEGASALLESGDFKGKCGEIAFAYSGKERLLLLGLGPAKMVTAEGLRRAYAAGCRAAARKKAKSCAILFPKIKFKGALRAVCEGVFLANYSFTKLKSQPNKEETHLERIEWIGVDPKRKKEIEQQALIARWVHFVRDLVNSNSDDKPPRVIAEIASSMKGVKTSVWDKRRLQEEKMGLILAVSRASSHEPYLATLSYRGNPKSKEHVVLVGKGVVYDTGGLSLKTPDNMMTMKADMAGAATVLGILGAAAELKLKINVTGVVPLVENCIGSKSYKLGDVYSSYSGKTVEVNNTDAEGRLILADAIAYAVDQLQPTCLIDLATLTGGIVIALGEEMAGFFSNDESIAKELLAASDATGEPLWRMPLNADYKETLKSDIADLINTSGRDGGAVKAALFIQEFVGEVPWAHIDLAGPAYVTKPKHYQCTKATGYGLRLALEFLESRAQ